MKIVKGNLIDLANEGHFEIIAHGCNCFNTMGSGIAKEMKERLPQVYDADLKTPYGDYEKLGTYSFAKREGENSYFILNLYTQYNFNKFEQKQDRFEYAAFDLLLQKMFHRWGGSHYGFPMIGMGRAAGDPERIMASLQSFDDRVLSSGGTVTLVMFNG